MKRSLVIVILIVSLCVPISISAAPKPKVEVESVFTADRDIKLLKGEEAGRFETDRGHRQMVNFCFVEDCKISIGIGYQKLWLKEVWPINYQNRYKKKLESIVFGIKIGKNIKIAKNLSTNLEARYLQDFQGGVREWEVSSRLAYHFRKFSPFIGIVYSDGKIKQGERKWRITQPWGIALGAEIKNFRVEIQAFPEKVSGPFEKMLKKRNQIIDGGLIRLSWKM